MTKEKEISVLWLVLCIMLVVQGLQVYEITVLKDRMNNVEAAFAKVDD